MDISSNEGVIPYKTEDQTLLPLTCTITTTTTTPNSNNNNNSNNFSKQQKIVKYRECLKNHAASMGGNATDGCGEFMPSGEEGTLEALRCSACNCHRNFHRKAVQGEIYSFGYIHHHHRPHPPPPALIMPLGAIHTTATTTGTTTTTSESEEGMMEENNNNGGATALPLNVMMVQKKRRRFRTKFTQEQKEKMLVFADKFGWKIPRQEEGLVQSFCQEIGVKRRVLKVWMHNNKHSLGKRMMMSMSMCTIPTPPQSH